MVGRRAKLSSFVRFFGSTVCRERASWSGKEARKPESRTPHKLKFHRLDGPVRDGFDCGDDEQNRFLLELAWPQQSDGYSRTHLAYVGGMLCGYVTLASSEIVLAKSERPETARFSRLPAVKLAQMAVDKRFAGHGLGSELVAFALVQARHISRTVGARYVILDAKPNRVSFYEGLGFVPNEKAQDDRLKEARAGGRPPEGIALSMRFDLYRPGAAEVQPAE